MGKKQREKVNQYVSVCAVDSQLSTTCCCYFRGTRAIPKRKRNPESLSNSKDSLIYLIKFADRGHSIDQDEYATTMDGPDLTQQQHFSSLLEQISDDFGGPSLPHRSNIFGYLYDDSQPHIIKI